MFYCKLHEDLMLAARTLSTKDTAVSCNVRFKS